MEKEEVKSIIEGMLFTWGEPLDINEMAKVLDLETKVIKGYLDEMIEEFNQKQRGLKIIQTNASYQLCTKPNLYHWINQLYVPEKQKGLSSASLETLSIIAYKQPITKSEIEYIRGVKCDKALKALLDREIIAEIGRLEQIGRPILYGTTDYFLQYFGIKNLNDLPEVQEVDEEEIKKEIENYTGE